MKRNETAFWHAFSKDDPKYIIDLMASRAAEKFKTIDAFRQRQCGISIFEPKDKHEIKSKYIFTDQSMILKTILEKESKGENFYELLR